MSINIFNRLFLISTLYSCSVFSQAKEIAVIGHAGAPSFAIANTLPSYQRAINDGADFIETDIVPTKDGALISIHENELSLTTNVSSFSQFANRKTSKLVGAKYYTGWFSEDFTLSEIKMLKVHERGPNTRPENIAYDGLHNVLTLDEVINIAEQNYNRTGKITGIYIEMKTPAYFTAVGLPVESKVLNTIAKYKYTRDVAPVYIEAFDPISLKLVRTKLNTTHSTLKRVRLLQLLNDLGPLYDAVNLATLPVYAAYADVVGPNKNAIFRDNSTKASNFVSIAHGVGLEVQPWSFAPENNNLPTAFRCSSVLSERCPSGLKKQLKMFFDAGIDGVFVDDPATAKEALAEY
ncbi:glycerophosphodiester phosphodiesterase family protein [Acinetobacter venetianus]|uniref:glycerophosphodiester phosphodiesterase family protein n=1 Tax=Acinetobacter venetianus TaxID=52133 RepID=UPI0010233355|nr:glycerophosphodiester phosphodiesterase family protein [Acinetobacter venetianus]RZG86920.1 glycerophosphodiester phosphodiesterase [Acinetobacter venetianus]